MDVTTSKDTAESAVGDAQRFRKVSVIAAVVAVPFLLGQLSLATLGLHSFGEAYGAFGGPLPAATRILLDLGNFGVLWAILLVVDAGIFELLRRLAKRYWIGLLFVPALAYLGIGTVLGLLLYMPMFNVVELVR